MNINKSPQIFDNVEILNLTPMMQQYVKIKNEHADYLLFYRMGDFYELFFNDAITAAEVLDITLTKRGKINDHDIPMCGVPYHSSNQYLDKLIKAGFKVAICEQLEKPEEAKKRGHKAVVRREVTRIITSGTIIEDNLLNAKNSNFLISLSLFEGQLAIACVEITTGDFFIYNSTTSTLSIDLIRFSPKEIVISDKLYADESIKKALFEYIRILTVRSNSIFDYVRCEKRIKDFYKIFTLDGIANFSKGEVISAGVLIEYLEHTQKENLPRLSKPKKISIRNFMAIDSSTRKNLEIDEDVHGKKNNSLLSVLNHTLTASGCRLLNLYIAAPLCNPIAINSRLDNIEFFIKNSELRVFLRNVLKHFPDIERALSKVFVKKATPFHLGIIRDALTMALNIAEHLTFGGYQLPKLIQSQVANISGFNELLQELRESLNETLPNSFKDGRFIKPEYSLSLDAEYNIKDNSHQSINNLRLKYSEITGINNLKISFNNVIGYFIDITPTQNSRVNDEIFIHKQTLGSSIRYITNELKELEFEIVNVDERINQIEQDLFEKISNQIVMVAECISLAAQAIAMLDLNSSLAELAIKNNYVKPHIDDSQNFKIEGGRHPIIETSLKGKFIANSCALNEDNLVWLLTGPNMAGKSTFLKQNAIICIMAQMGCYVPAKSAHIGVVDRLFSRIGAGDDISTGQSTFMVEMVEAATILNNATSKSLVILDEIGRGTATYDGLSIAWSIVENIHNDINCRTLFATHYHELTDLENVLPKLECHMANIKEWEGKVIFLHEIVKGKADQSFGIHVAELAGMPSKVTLRASEILSVLQSKEKVNLNIVSANTTSDSINDSLLSTIMNIDIDELTPKDAFNLIYNIKNKLQK